MQFINPAKVCKGMEMGDIPSNREILKTTLSVAWPSVLESFFVNLAGMVDNHHGGHHGLLRHRRRGPYHPAQDAGPWRCSFP